ncbi:MAG: dienelactone hydrolase family protein [Ramlibacter sp.]|nr:dienelactone hydrolase family protein [Ramlibacter sp.]
MALILGLLAAGGAGPVAAATPQAVTLNSRDGTALTGWLFRPEPVADTPRGTVIALHGCGGLYATTGSRKGLLNARHQAMADTLVAAGYNVLFPDSLTPRGETSLCTQKIGQRRIDQTERRADALGALAWLAAQPWADAQRVALLGWSHGGSAVLSATDATRADVQALAPPPVLAVAFYPGCSAPLRSGYRPSTRLVLMLGALDDWTPPQPCIDLGQRVGAEVNVYPDSYHDFDSPVGQVRVRADVPNGVNPGQGVHVGPNPAARDKAYARLRDLLVAALKR